MKLNLGSGDKHVAGYLSVDLREDCGANVVADVRFLPYDDGSVEAIIAHDLLEHFSKFETEPLLTEWHRVLCSGGEISIRCPNMHVLAVQIAGSHDRPGAGLDDFINNVMGGHRYGPNGAWDTHHWNFTPTTLRLALEKAGFTVESLDEATNMTAIARKR